MLPIDISLFRWCKPGIWKWLRVESERAPDRLLRIYRLDDPPGCHQVLDQMVAGREAFGNSSCNPNTTRKSKFALHLPRFFDPCEEVQRASAEYLMACVPTFAGEDRVQTLPHELICQFICFGEHVTDQTVSNPGMLKACQDICRKLDGHWPRWAGWQEGLKDPDHSVEALASQVSIAMLWYLRRRFSQWQHDQHDLAQGNALQQQHHEAGSMS